MKNSQILAEIKESAKTLFSAIITLISPLITAVATLIKYLWKLTRLVIIVGVVALIVAMCVSRSIYHRISPRYYVYKYDVVERYRVKDTWQNKWVTGYLTSVEKNFGCDSLVRISKKDIFGNNKRYGYFDVRSGAIAIEPQFCAAGVFSEGLATASNEEDRGFIDTTGKFVVKFNEKLTDIGSMVLNNGHTIAHPFNLDKQTGYGVINTKGEWVLEPIYEKIVRSTQNCYIVSTEFREGLWSVEKGWIIEPECISIEPYNCDEGFSVLCENRHYIVDADGNIINPFVFSYTEMLTYQAAGDNSEISIASDYMLFGLDEKCVGVYNIRTNKVVIPAKYTYIYMVSKDIFVVQDGMDIEYLVDKNGNVIKPININVN